MKIKIVSDGTGPGTKVVDAETGELVEMVQSAKWSISGPDELAVTEIVVAGVEVDVEGEIDAPK